MWCDLLSHIYHGPAGNTSYSRGLPAMDKTGSNEDMHILVIINTSLIIDFETFLH